MGDNRNVKQTVAMTERTTAARRKILLLHGNRQTGQLLLGRMEKLQKRLARNNIKLVAPDAPFPTAEDANLRQWWDRHDNEYRGLDESLEMLQKLWKEEQFEGIFGFSQGARLAHLIALLHEFNGDQFSSLRYVIMVAGYDAPIPTGFVERCCPQRRRESIQLDISSLHVWGRHDALITPDQSQAVLQYYKSPQTHQHDGKHFVPVKASNVDAYLDFIESSVVSNEAVARARAKTKPLHQQESATKPEPPDEETAQIQQDEVEALGAIFPDEFQLLSAKHNDENYEHPISYRIALPESDVGVWPPHAVSIKVEYPPTYPAECAPKISLEHDNNMMEFTSSQVAALMNTIREAAEAEMGMPSVLGCVYAAREFFESGVMATASALPDEGEPAVESEGVEDKEEGSQHKNSLLKPASKERIHECNLQGLAIAESLLNRAKINTQQQNNLQEAQSDAALIGKGGSWKYCIGLVGKPSAGKSTFFNAATAFARQRGGADNKEVNALGGATMAPHPFTTIDPNVGYCLVPAPPGSCPEEEEEEENGFDKGLSNVGSTHGRDSKGRRLLPVMLKDVAGLVPGAYQGRGRGNKFLNDLTDADVLLHVVDVSGTADAEGNTVGVEEEGTRSSDGRDTAAHGAGSHPLNDLAWISDELIQWIYTNLLFKWDTISRRGRVKLESMFSGYGQNQAVLWDILLAVEKYLDQTEHRDHALDHLDQWDEGDVHRLVSAFLGVRFPMALALNKSDLPSSASNVKDVQEALPINGAHVGIPLCARKEMTFVRWHLELASSDASIEKSNGTVPVGVWQCLQSAMALREPVLAFPVCDMTTYAPLPGMIQYATSDASLPNTAMISCLHAAGGSVPSLWDDNLQLYKEDNESQCVLRDAIVMKPGSTVEDAFLTLKRMGALSGEFVRAEGAGRVGEKPKLIPKSELINKSNRILKIMTNKRRDWQS